MKTTNTLTILIALAVLALCMPAHLSAQYPPNQLVAFSGVPCSYGPITNTFSSTVGCWGDGACATAPFGSVQLQYPSVSVYQWWSCSVGVVTGSGNSTVETISDPRYNADQPYPFGLQAVGRAVVFDPLLPTEVYGAVDMADCNGYVYYSGDYSYYC